MEKQFSEIQQKNKKQMASAGDSISALKGHIDPRRANDKDVEIHVETVGNNFPTGVLVQETSHAEHGECQEEERNRWRRVSNGSNLSSHLLLKHALSWCRIKLRVKESKSHKAAKGKVSEAEECCHLSWCFGSWKGERWMFTEIH